MKKQIPNRLFISYSSALGAYKAENEVYGEAPYIIGTYDEVIAGVKKMFSYPEDYEFRLDSPFHDRPVWTQL